MKRLKDLFRMALPYKVECVVAILMMIVNIILAGISMSALIPLFDKVLINEKIALGDAGKVPVIGQYAMDIQDWINSFSQSDMLFFLTVFFVVGMLLKGLTQYINVVSMEKVSQCIARDIRVALFNKLFRFPALYYAKNRSGDIISRITNEVTIVQIFFSGHFSKTILDTAWMLPSLFWVFLLERKITFYCLVIFPLALLPIILIGRQIRKISKKGHENIGDISAALVEVLRAVKIIKVFGRFQDELERFRALCARTIRLRLRAKKKEALLSPAVELIGVVSVLLLIYAMLPKLVSGTLSKGSFVLYISCLVLLIKPLKSLGKIQAILQNALAAMDRIDQLLEEPDEPCELSGERKILHLGNGISFNNVHYGYVKGQPVLRDISFELPKGKVVALVGPSGSGKTTIANLLPRFFDPDQGQIRIDGVSMTTLHVDSIRSLFGMVSQEPVLFNVSISENIRYGRPAASQTEVIQAATVARAHDFIMKTREGYDTVIGEWGARLSGGEKQRIALARALLRDPEIFIFDEATSALDSENERFVQEAIDRVMENRTVLVIAHRLSTIVKAHQILVLDQGRILQRGTHASLLQQGGLYKKLYEMHFVTH